MRSQLRRIIEHCLKLAWSPARTPRLGWRETIIDVRTILEDKLSPTLRRDLRRNLPHLYDQARRNTEAALSAYGEHSAADQLPVGCPYRLADLLRHDWYPENRHGLRELL